MQTRPKFEVQNSVAPHLWPLLTQHALYCRLPKSLLSQSLKYLFSSFTCSTKYSNYDVPLVRMTPKSAFHQSKLSLGSAAAAVQHQHSRRSLVCIRPARQITHSFNWKLASQSKFEDLLSLSLTHSYETMERQKVSIFSVVFHIHL